MFKISCCSFKITKKTIHWMVLTFMIISIMVAIAPLVQLKQDTASSYDVFASPQPKENVTITALFNQMGKAGMGKALLTNLTNYNEKWGRASEWYQSNLAGGIYKGKIYGIWAWTDVRGIWYWKDLLNQANVDPNMLKTWEGYIAAAKKLNTVLRPQ